jgi:electron transfer flavoprotein beta subunit
MELDVRTPDRNIEEGLRMVELEAPEQDDTPAELLGEGPEAAPAVVEVLQELEVL